jgi:hypothetical protein
MHAVHAGIIRSVSFTRGWGRAGGKTRAIGRLTDCFLIKKLAVTWEERKHSLLKP